MTLFSQTEFLVPEILKQFEYFSIKISHFAGNTHKYKKITLKPSNQSPN